MDGAEAGRAARAGTMRAERRLRLGTRRLGAWRWARPAAGTARAAGMGTTTARWARAARTAGLRTSGRGALAGAAWRSLPAVVAPLTASRAAGRTTARASMSFAGFVGRAARLGQGRAGHQKACGRSQEETPIHASLRMNSKRSEHGAPIGNAQDTAKVQRRCPGLEQPQRLEAGHALAPDHQVVVDIDLQRLAGLDDLLGHVDVGPRRGGVSTGVIMQ